MVAAANQLRIPYWDWGANAVPPPEIIEYKSVSIMMAPDGRRFLVANPFLAYTLPKSFLDQSKGSIYPTYYEMWKNTVRCPTSQMADAASQPEVLKEWVSFIDLCRLQMLMRNSYQCPQKKSVLTYHQGLHHADRDQDLGRLQQPYPHQWRRSAGQQS
jgi:hypothetical protein